MIRGLLLQLIIIVEVTADKGIITKIKQISIDLHHKHSKTVLQMKSLLRLKMAKITKMEL